MEWVCFWMSIFSSILSSILAFKCLFGYFFEESFFFPKSLKLISLRFYSIGVGIKSNLSAFTLDTENASQNTIFYLNTNLAKQTNRGQNTTLRDYNRRKYLFYCISGTKSPIFSLSRMPHVFNHHFYYYFKYFLHTHLPQQSDWFFFVVEIIGYYRMTKRELCRINENEQECSKFLVYSTFVFKTCNSTIE